MITLTIVVLVLTIVETNTATKISHLDFQAEDNKHVKVTVVFETQEYDKKVTDLTLYQRPGIALGRFLRVNGNYEMTANISACDKHEELYVKYTDLSPGQQKKPDQYSQLFEYNPTSTCPKNYGETFQGKTGDEKTHVTESTIAIGVGAGAGGLAILALTVFLILHILKKRRRTAPSSGRKIVDENPLYHTYYAGDERLNDTAEVNM